MPSLAKLKKELIHYDRITYVFLMIVLGYSLILLIIARLAFGYVSFEAMGNNLYSKILNYSFLIIGFSSVLFVIYPSIKASFIRKKIYEMQAPQILEQYRLGGIFALILFLSAMALIFWVVDVYNFGQIVELIIIDIVALGIALGAYALGVRGLDLPKSTKK